jgi:hypothetical protein
MRIGTARMIAYAHIGRSSSWMSQAPTDRVPGYWLYLRRQQQRAYIMQPIPVRISSAFFFCSAFKAS